MNRAVWKLPFIHKTVIKFCYRYYINDFSKNIQTKIRVFKKLKFYNRSSIIPQAFGEITFLLHFGKKCKYVTTKKRHIMNFKLGEFGITKKIGLYCHTNNKLQQKANKKKKAGKKGKNKKSSKEKQIAKARSRAKAKAKARAKRKADK
jgi:ribosomal protein S19